MNCTRTRLVLAEFVHGGLTPADRKQLAVHLQTCPVCRGECAALQEVGRLLDRLPVTEPQVDLARLYRDAAAAHQRRLRRWRRFSVVLGVAAAAALLLALVLRCEVRMEAHQFVVRWGAPPTAVAPQPPPAPVIEERLAAGISPEVEERLRLLGDLVEMLAAEGEARDRRQCEELVRLKARLHELHQDAANWHAIAERDFSALYGVQFPPKRKGEFLP